MGLFPVAACGVLSGGEECCEGPAEQVPRVDWKRQRFEVGFLLGSVVSPPLLPHCCLLLHDPAQLTPTQLT